MLSLKIVFEDKFLLVVDKPAGLVVNKAKTVDTFTLQDWLEKYLKLERLTSFNKEEENFFSRQGIVHRLDKETSGLLVIAKTPPIFSELQSQFKERKVKKFYLAMVHGKIEPKKGDIKMPLARSHKERKKFEVSLEGRMAITEYWRKAVYKRRNKEKNELFSFLLVKPKTGRTHQIRVHLSYLGYPLVSDSLYLGKKIFKQDKEWCPRLFLHSYKLGFFHPIEKKPLLFKSLLPKDLAKAKEIFLEKISDVED